MNNLVLLVLVCLTTAAYASEPPTNIQCGTIFDGLTEGKFDIQSQISRTTLAANWFGFGENVLSYEWAIFSDSVKLPSNSKECLSQLRAVPDVQPWKNTRKETNGMNTKLRLQTGHKYFAAVRATLRSGTQIIALSDGVKIDARVENEEKFNSFVTQQNYKKEEKSVNTRNVEQGPFSCTIDENNRCRSSQISVSERLNELYGVARFPFEFSADIISFEGGVLSVDDDDNNDDDDGGRYVWVIAPVLGVVALALCLLLLCLLLLFLCAKGISLPEREEKPKKAPPMEFDQVEESKEYGQREGVDVADASTHTVVEFPDTNIRRLSISHDNREEVDVGGGDSPRRGRQVHPIMTSASSSFRDYRSNV